jgi:hypothetical protein
VLDSAEKFGWWRMSELKKRERIAVEGLANRFSARSHSGDDRLDEHINVGAKQISVTLRTLGLSGRRRSGGDKPHLRFDRVVVEVMKRLRAALGRIVPGGTTVVVTLTAPIRLPSKTATAIEERVRRVVDRRPTDRDTQVAIHGNGVRIRVLRDGLKRAPKMIGFVHNFDTDPVRLMNMTRELVQLISGEAARRAGNAKGDRWLAVKCAEGSSSLEAFRYIYSQLGFATDFRKVLIVFRDGRVETLTR